MSNQFPSQFINVGSVRELIPKAWESRRDGECVMTYHYLAKDFALLTKKEFMLQMALWKKIGVKILDCNTKERELPDGTKGTMFVIQPKDLNDAPHACPLGLAFNRLVSGFTYFTNDKFIISLVKAYSKECS